MRDAWPRFTEAGVKLYAVSYDDTLVLREFAEKQRIPYPLLSDVDSAVIRDYGILNDSIRPGDGVLYGIPYPGVYVCNAAGVVTASFFHDTYKKRDSAELYLDAALGALTLRDTDLREERADAEVSISLGVHGGRGSLRQGIIRQLVLRFELAEGLHIYGEPVPEGMTPLQVRVSGPPGLVCEAPLLPPTEELRLSEMDISLRVWSGRLDVLIPFHATSELVSETRPLTDRTATISVSVRYQACNEATCLLPKSETFELTLPLETVDVPNISLHRGHGQKEGGYDGTRHALRLLWRKVRRHPLGFIRYLLEVGRLEKAARARRRKTAQKP